MLKRNSTYSSISNNRQFRSIQKTCFCRNQLESIWKQKSKPEVVSGPACISEKTNRNVIAECQSLRQQEDFFLTVLILCPPKWKAKQTKKNQDKTPVLPHHSHQTQHQRPREVHDCLPLRLTHTNSHTTITQLWWRVLHKPWNAGAHSRCHLVFPGFDEQMCDFSWTS